MATRIIAVRQPQLPPLEMPDRFRHEVIYFCTSAGEAGAPADLPPGDWWLPLDEARKIQEAGVLRLVSPLDSAATAEIEISEDHERWLDWMIAHKVEHIRLE